MLWWQYLITGFFVLVAIATGIGTAIYFLTTKPTPTPPIPPTPPAILCKNPKKLGCDPIKFCMKYECDDKSIKCVEDSTCSSVYTMPLNTLGYLTNSSTSQYVLSQTVNNKGMNGSAAVMAQKIPSGYNYIVTPISCTGSQFLTTSDGGKIYYALSKGPLITTLPTDSTTAKWYYNGITGQIVDDLENPTLQLSLTTSTLPYGTFQQLVAIPYATVPSNKEVWIFMQSY